MVEAPRTVDPIELARFLWPSLAFYRQQREIIDSVWSTRETVVASAHMMGKSFAAAAICLLFFLTRHPCRVVTTSVDGLQLEGVLWGEIRNLIKSSAYPLDHECGGPLIVNHMHIRKVVDGQECGLSYLIGRVAAQGEGMSGHHIARTGDGIPRTLFVADECSGVDAISLEKPTEWANRMLLAGNCYECNNRFRWAIEGKPGTDDHGGNIRSPDGKGYARRVFHMSALESPNVRLAMAQQRAGREPTGEILVPGVLPYEDYLWRQQYWDEIKQAVGLHARFYKGAGLLLFPGSWLDRANHLAELLRGRPRQARGLGIDTGEGVASTSMSAVDELGLIEQLSRPTPDTDVIPREAIAFMTRHNVLADRICFDRGGGGKQAADRLRAQGYNVRTVAFGESLIPEPRRGHTSHAERIAQREARYTYVRRRDQLYGTLSELLDPAADPAMFGFAPGWPGFAIPREYTELRRQLAPIPKQYDNEGRLKLPPKRKKNPGSNEVCLEDLIGCSPDESDSLTLSIYAMLNTVARAKAGRA